ncbi:MAG: hypothetical protein HY370_06205 [Proteobacteria bacterium]|nr:hypothetical protein [Pseudomonadota bacterium]
MASGFLSYMSMIPQVPDSVDRMIASAGIGLATAIVAEVAGMASFLGTGYAVNRIDPKTKNYPTGEILLGIVAGDDPKSKWFETAGWCAWALSAFLTYNAVQNHFVSGSRQAHEKGNVAVRDVSKFTPASSSTPSP